jgi:hypothetical protein
MNTKQIALTGLAVIGLLGCTGAAWAQSGRPATKQDRQDDKNLMRNLGTGLGAAALSSAKNGRIGDAIVLGAGAALAGKKYEDARVAQRDENRYGRDDRYSRDDRYNTSAYDRDRYDNDRSSSRWERERYERERRERAERELRERLLRERIERERCERIERERREREREEREARIRWEREHRGHSWEREHDRDERCRDHRH